MIFPMSFRSSFRDSAGKISPDLWLSTSSKCRFGGVERCSGRRLTNGLMNGKARPEGGGLGGALAAVQVAGASGVLVSPDLASVDSGLSVVAVVAVVAVASVSAGRSNTWIAASSTFLT